MRSFQPLSDFCQLIVDCEHKTAPVVGEGYPSIRTPNVGPGRLLLDQVNRVDQATYKAWTKRAVPQAGDLIVAREAPLGNVAIIPSGIDVCLGQRTVLVRPDPNRAIPGFLCYFLLSDYAQNRFHAAATGATVPHLNMRDIRNLPMPPLPSLDEQRRIASILSAYDDLIEVNRRRVAILEDLARRLYEEWFIHLRFPGHQAVPLQDTPDGPLPEGWSWSPLSSIALVDNVSVSPGASPDGLFTHYSYPAFDKAKLPAVETGSAILSNKLSLKAPTVLLGKLNPRTPRIWPVLDAGEHPQVSSTEFIPLTSRGQVGPGLLAAYVSSAAFMSRLQGLALGTSNSHQRVRPGDVLATAVLVPSPAIMDLAELQLGPMQKLVAKMRHGNASLAAARDLLLPRLLSGQLPTAAAQPPTLAIAAE